MKFDPFSFSTRQLVLLTLSFLVLYPFYMMELVGALSTVSIPVSTTSRPLYNFGPASTRDKVLFTAERPGNNPNEKTAKVPDSAVRDWISYVKGKGISTVVALLDDNELSIYEPTGLMNLYREGGLQAFVQPMGAPSASNKILDLLRNAEASSNTGGGVVTHCTGGVGRCGRVAGAWLVHRYNLSPQQASKETLDCAQRHNMHRNCDPDLLEEWLEVGGGGGGGEGQLK